RSLTIVQVGLGAGDILSGGEMSVFEPGEAPIKLTAVGEAEAVFVLGSAVPHPHDLHLGYYSVHTSAEELAHGEARIAELGAKLAATGDRRTGSGVTPVFR